MIARIIFLSVFSKLTQFSDIVILINAKRVTGKLGAFVYLEKYSQCEIRARYFNFYLKGKGDERVWII